MRPGNETKTKPFGDLNRYRKRKNKQPSLRVGKPLPTIPCWLLPFPSIGGMCLQCLLNHQDHFLGAFFSYRQVTLFEEYMLLKEFEKRENSFANKVNTKLSEKEEMQEKV